MSKYAFCDDNCKHEVFTKEEVINLLYELINNGELPDSLDTSFVTRVKELNAGGYVTFWLGTQREYNALEEKPTNCLYIITDGTQEAEFQAIVRELVIKYDAAMQEAARAYNRTMVREFHSRQLAPGMAFTTPTNNSKLFTVLLDDSGATTGLTVDWQTVYQLGTVGYGYTVHVAVEGTTLNRTLTVMLNEDLTLTFTPPAGASILNICGYY